MDLTILIDFQQHKSEMMPNSSGQLYSRPVTAEIGARLL